MTLLTNTFEGGTNTTALTVANTGGTSGNAFDSVVSAPVFDNTRAMHGSFSMQCVSGATANYVLWNVSSTDIALRCYVYITAAPTADYTLMRVNGSAGANAMTLNLLSTGKLRLIQSGNGTLATGTVNFPTNQWVRVELRTTQSATAANVSAAMYTGDGPTTLETIGSTTGNSGTVAFTAVRFGKNATTGLDAQWFDDCATQTAAAGAFLGPSVALTSASYASIASSTGWTATGGTVLAVLSDASDATYITSSDNPTAVLFDGTLAPLSVPTGDFTVQVRCQKLNSTSGTMTAKLYDGATLRATVSAVAIPDATTTVNVTFLAANISAVTSWAAGVRLTIEVTAS